MADPQELLEELDELKHRLTALMVEFPQLDMEKPLEQINQMLTQPMPWTLKLLIEELYGLKILFEKLLEDKKYDNTWHLVRPCHVLVTWLLSADE